MPLFEWDEVKNDVNRCKHGVSFELASEVFDDPKALSRLDERFEYGEERWITLGCVRNVLVLVVAHTIREDDDSSEETIRIISARKATRKERGCYGQEQ